MMKCGLRLVASHTGTGSKSSSLLVDSDLGRLIRQSLKQGSLSRIVYMLDYFQYSNNW